MSFISATEAIDKEHLTQAGHEVDLARIGFHIAKQNAEESIREAPRQLRDCDAKIKAGHEQFLLIKEDLVKDIKECIVAQRGLIHARKLLVMSTESAYEMIKARIEMARVECQILQELDSFVERTW